MPIRTFDFLGQALMRIPDGWDVFRYNGIVYHRRGVADGWAFHGWVSSVGNTYREVRRDPLWRLVRES